MSLKFWPDKLPAIWRLALLLAGVAVVTTWLFFMFVNIAVRQDMRVDNRERLTEDLLRYSMVYSEGGLAGIKKLLHSSQPLWRNSLRLRTAAGQVLFEEIQTSMQPYQWPTETVQSLLQKDDLDVLEINRPDHSATLFAGAIRLGDGHTLWLGRTDIRSLMQMHNIERHLWFAAFTATLIIFLPLTWFSQDVVRPLRFFALSAERMRLPGRKARVRVPPSIPELNALAGVVNTGLEQIQSLTRELQSTNDFLAHELRTPLARIRGNLERYHDETHNRKAQEAAARSLEEIDRAAQLVHTLLTIRAGDHAALRLHRQVTSVDDLLTNLVELFAPAAEDRRLSLKLIPGLSLTLNIDRELLTQAVSNFLDNALAYTPSGGSIVVRWQAEGTGANISVEDTGPGIHPEEMDSIWERYVRGTAARPKSSGMGLGLSLVRSIAMAHGGTASANNREGARGAVFWIYIPGE